MQPTLARRAAPAGRQRKPSHSRRAGLGAEPPLPGRSRHLAESLGAPVIDTPKSKGALGADHPLFAGTIGLTRDDPVYELLDEADSIVAIGFDVVELVKPWDYTKPLIWIAEWPNHDPQNRLRCGAGRECRRESGMKSALLRPERPRRIGVLKE